MTASHMWPIDPAALTPFLAAIAIVELTPGPNMGWLAVISASHGRRSGLLAVAGITLGLAVYMLASAAGLMEVFLAYPPLYQALRWVGVGFLLWLAWEAWTGAADTSPGHVAPAIDGPGLFWRGLVANLLNPKAAIFYVTLLPNFIAPARASPFVQATIFGSAHLLVSMLVHVGIVLFAGGAALAVAPKRIALRRFFAVSIAAIAFWLAWETGPGAVARG